MIIQNNWKKAYNFKKLHIITQFPLRSICIHTSVFVCCEILTQFKSLTFFSFCLELLTMTNDFNYKSLCIRYSYIFFPTVFEHLICTENINKTGITFLRCHNNILIYMFLVRSTIEYCTPMVRVTNVFGVCFFFFFSVCLSLNLLRSAIQIKFPVHIANYFTYILRYGMVKRNCTDLCVFAENGMCFSCVYFSYKFIRWRNANKM